MSMPMLEIPTPRPVDGSRFKAAMQRFPSGVVIATTRNREGLPRGFTASSFTSVSLSPPMVSLCLSASAECHRDFCEANHFSINILRQDHEALAGLFATRGADKFSGTQFVDGDRSMPLLSDAVARMVCRLRATHTHGDHTLLIGEVEAVDLGDDVGALLRFRQRFARIAMEVQA